MRLAGFQIGRPVVGIALGSGSARGWAHIGVLRALEEEGIRPKVATGTSAGGVVAAFYAASALDKLEEFVRNYRGFGKTIAHLDFGLGNAGMITGKRWLANFLEAYLPVRDFRQLNLPLGMVATDLISMKEVHITSGPLIPAIRSTVAVPGFFSPLEYGNMMLVDGGLLNPVPVDLARVLGADIVIAVDLNARVTTVVPDSLAEVVHRSIETMMNRVRETNMALMKPEVIIAPNLNGVGFLDYHLGEIAIAEGYRATLEMMPEIKRQLSKPVRRLHPVFPRKDVLHREIGSWKNP
jgi:NTE family protein